MKATLRSLTFFMGFLVTLFVQMDAQAQSFDWIKNYGGQDGNAVAADGYGNSVIVGTFQGVAQFGANQVSSYGSLDAFIVKLDAQGNCLWARHAGGSGGGYAMGVSIDGSGNSYVTGYFIGTATFGSIQLTSFGSYDIFLAKYDNNGNLVWVKQAGGQSDDWGMGIATDINGNSYLTGNFQLTATFGSIQLSSYGDRDVFVAKYDANGNCLWVRQGGGYSIDEGRGIAIDSQGNSYITGYYLYTGTFGNVQLSSYGDRDIFIAKYDKNGTCLWARHGGGSSIDYGNGIGADAAGNCYVTGYTSGSSMFENTSSAGIGAYDAFIAKYDLNGTLAWVKKAGGYDYDEGRGIGVDAGGNAYVTGYFRGTVKFDNISLANNGDRDIFMAKYDMDGNCRWAKQATGSGDQTGTGAGVGVNGAGYFIGGYSSPITIDQVQLPNSGVYLVKTVGIVPTLAITSPNGNEIWKTYSTHNITWTGTPDGYLKIEITLDNGATWIPVANSIAASAGSYTFTVPPFTPSSQCKIRLTSLTNPVSSTSANLFTITSNDIPNLTVTSPNTYVKWNAGSSHLITWNMAGSIQNVKIEYTPDNGYTWSPVVGSISASSVKYQWTVPAVASTKCRIRISSADTATVNDVSDTLFTTTDLTITSPNGGEKLKAGTVKTIQWRAGGIGTINLLYSLNSGVSWNVIASNINAGSGSYSWTVPQVISSGCIFKIVDPTDSTLYDLVDTACTIWKPVTETQTPGLGQVTLVMGATNVTFSAFVVTAGPLELTYYSGEAPSASIPRSLNSVNQYYWSANITTLAFMNGKVSIPLTALEGVVNPNKLVWVKRNNSLEAWTLIGGSINNGILSSTVPFTAFKELAIGVLSPASSELVDVIDFGNNKMFQPRDSVFTIRNIGGDTLKILSITVSDSSFRVMRMGPILLASEESLNDTLRFTPRSFGMVSAVVRIVGVDSVAIDSIRISGSSPYPVAIANPGSLQFGNVKKGESKTMTLVLTNSSLNDLTIDSLIVRKKQFAMAFTGNVNRIGKGDTVKVSMTFSPDSLMQFTDTLLVYSNAQTRMSRIVLSGGGVLTGVTQEGSNIPAQFSLQQNYPNPFNPSTVIGFSLTEDSQVMLKVYDMVGRELQSLVDGRLSAGYHSVMFNAGNLASGVYLYRLIATGGQQQHSATRCFVLMK